jgi:hypothetical protein
MNLAHTSILRITMLGAASLVAALAWAAEGDTVTSPAKRQEALDQGKQLVAPKEITPITTDPFYSEAFAETVAALQGRSPGVAAPGPGDTTSHAPAGPRTDHDVLAAIAASLKPSGYIVLGDQPSLSFGQKRVKPGGTLTINFEGKEYTLEITSIDHTNFTLRLNREEFTRTIK